MPHEAFFGEDGKAWPSVTQVVGIIDKSRWLVPWAGKHGTIKAKALLSLFPSRIQHGSAAVEASPETLVGLIPDAWFERYKIKREEFWKDQKQISEESAEKGTEFHRRIHVKLIGNGNDGPPSEEISAIQCWTERVKLTNPQCEQKVINKEYGYHGTYDCLALLDNIPTLIDWKRTTRIEDRYFIQLAGYALSLRVAPSQLMIVRPYSVASEAKEDKTEVKETKIIHSFKGLKVKVETIAKTNIAYFADQFLMCLKLWKALNN